MAEHATGHGSPDDQYLETPPGAGYEHTDASVWIIAKFLLWLAVSAVVVHIGLGLIYALMIEQAMQVGEQPYPLAAQQEERLPPPPRLQQDPSQDLRVFRGDENTLLTRYGWMNKNAGIVHIPVDEAMRLTVERGLPSRAQDAAQPQPTPGLMASDASSGRTMERRRQ